MSRKLNEKCDVSPKKIQLLIKFREYIIKNQEEEKNIIDFYIEKKGIEHIILLRIICKTTLVSGKVGVRYVREMKGTMDKKGLKRGIIIGLGFSYSARREASMNGIETIDEGKIPPFNLFKHNLVPFHEILKKEEADSLLKSYHIEAYQLPQISILDPAVFLIGAKKGDIIKITRKSPTAGIHVTYRHAV